LHKNAEFYLKIFLTALIGNGTVVFKKKKKMLDFFLVFFALDASNLGHPRFSLI